MRKTGIIILLLFSVVAGAQSWQAEIALGGLGYKGDMTDQVIPFKTIGPAGAVYIKYNTGGIFTLRAGVGYGRLKGDDNFSKDPVLRVRQLNFKTSVLEFQVATELNLMDPEFYYSYPYLLAGAGIFHFNPYSYDDSGNKTYLKPLSTEGQGLPEYPNRKPYSLTQVCIPLGLGWKYRVNERYEVAAEIGIRALFTDHLDDVSYSYVDPDVLRAARGDKAVEMAYRQDNGQMVDGAVRGNSTNKDLYFFSGVKLAFDLKKKKKATPSVPAEAQ